MKKPPTDPDFNRLLKVIYRQGEPDRVPFIELFADQEIIAAVTGEPLPAAAPDDRELRDRYLQRSIRFQYELGYDYVAANVVVNFRFDWLKSEDTAELKRDQRTWINESDGVITSWEDFEAYPFPKPEEIDYYNVEYLGKHLPDGMKIIFEGPGGVLENIMWLMGYEPFALALWDDPALVQAVAEKVGGLLVNVFSTAVEMPNVGAVWLGDDMGFKTSTMISVQHLRQYVFPWQKKLVDIAHAHGVPFLLHSCGNLEGVMDDLIDDVGIDGKHSFEDVILPVAQAKRRWGKRVAILGGVDMDFLTRRSEEEVRVYTRKILEECAPGGGYALGTGNTVANYIPVRNYLAMLDEGWNYGKYK